MMDLVESPSGTGELFDGEKSLGRVRYQLYVYREPSSAPGTNEPTARRLIEGYLESGTAVSIQDLFKRRFERRVPMTLQLQDGRRLDLQLGDPGGQVVPRGNREFY